MFVSKSLFSEGQEGPWGRCFLCPGRTVAGPEGGWSKDQDIATRTLRWAPIWALFQVG